MFSLIQSSLDQQKIPSTGKTTSSKRTLSKKEQEEIKKKVWNLLDLHNVCRGKSIDTNGKKLLNLNHCWKCADLFVLPFSTTCPPGIQRTQKAVWQLHFFLLPVPTNFDHFQHVVNMGHGIGFALLYDKYAFPEWKSIFIRAFFCGIHLFSKSYWEHSFS